MVKEKSQSDYSKYDDLGEINAAAESNPNLYTRRGATLGIVVRVGIMEAFVEV